MLERTGTTWAADPISHTLRYTSDIRVIKFKTSAAALENALVICSVAAAVGIAVYRIQFGVDFTDEAFYAAVPDRLSRGDLLFADEASLLLSALPVLPFVAIWRLIAGTTGIILFLRVLHLVLRTTITAIVALSLREMIPTKLAIATSLVVFGIVPMNLNTISYNTLGADCFAGGCFAAVISGPNQSRWQLVAGALHSLAVLAYPPLVLPVSVFVAACLYYRRLLGTRYAVGTLPLVILFVCAVVLGGISALARSLRYAFAASTHVPLNEKLLQIPRTLVETAPHLPLLAIVVVGLVLATVRRMRFGILLLPVLAVVVAWNRMPLLYASLAYATWLGLIGVLIAIPLLGERDIRVLVACVLVPSLVAGCTTALSSSNGSISFGVGGIAAAQVTVALLVLAAVRRFQVGTSIVLVALVAIWLFPVVAEYLPTAVYRDADVPLLTVRVPNGPYAGLRTTRSKYAFLSALQSDVRSVERGSARTILFYYDFPAGYLMTRLRAVAPSVWMFGSKPTARAIDPVKWLDHQGWPDIVVRLEHVPVQPTAFYPPPIYRLDRLEDAFGHYTVVIKRHDYTMRVRQPGLLLPPRAARRTH